MSKRKIKAGKGEFTLGIKDKLKSGLAKAKKRLMQFAKLGALAGGAAAGGALASVKGFTDLGAELTKINQQTGVSIKTLSELRFMAKKLGVDFEDVVGATEEFNIRLGETLQTGAGPMADAFKLLKLDAKELAKLPVDQAIGKIGDELNKLDSQQRGFLADEIFGGDAFKILPLLRQGADGLGEMATQANNLGAVMSDDAANSATQLRERLVELQTVGQAAMISLGEVFAPVLTAMVDGAGTATAQISQFFSDNFGGIRDALQAGELGLAAQIGMMKVRIAFADAFASILDFIGVSLSDVSKLIAEVLKQLAQLIAKANIARVGVVNKLSGLIGDAVGVDTSLEQKAAMRQAKAFQDSINTIDTSGLADSVRDALDPELLRDSLAELETQSADAKDAAIAARAAASEIKAASPNLPKIAKLADKSKALDSAGSFSIAALNRSMPNRKKFEEKTAKNTKVAADQLKKVVSILPTLAGKFT